MCDASPSPADPRLPVSLVVTVRNEVETLPDLLESLEGQVRSPEEVIIIDGGSTDGTIQLLESYDGPLPLRWVSAAGANISTGRNRGIGMALGPIIAVTDAGVRLDEQWLLRLTEPYETDQPIEAVAGWFTPEPRNWFEAALGATTLPSQEEIHAASFLPSSRSVSFTKTAWAKVGGYPEWLDYCEDLVFGLRLRSAGFAFRWAPLAIARFRPRPDLAAFFLQYWRYARGDGKAGLWPRRHLVRYGVYLTTVVSLACSESSPLRWPLLATLCLAGVGYLWRSYARLVPWLKERPFAQQVAMIAAVPVLRATGDVAKMLGYPAGVWWRRARRGD